MTDDGIVITAADDCGIPTHAECPSCGWTWERPDTDRWADTLPITAMRHRRDHD